MYSLISNIKSTYILYISVLIGDQNLKNLTILFVMFNMDRAGIDNGRCNGSSCSNGTINIENNVIRFM